MGVPYELYATLSSTGMNSAYVSGLQLRDIDLVTGMVYAASEVPILADAILSRDRDMSILYTGVGTGQPVGLFNTAVTNSSPDFLAMTMEGNFQWGVKVFTDNYVDVDTPQ